MKKVISLLLTIAMLFSIVPLAVNAGTGKTVAEISQQIIDTYKTALARSGRTTFSGYCATYVNWQLVVLGINSSYVSGNGNAEFDNYKNKTSTTGGYSVTAYSASNYTISSALNAITANGANNAYNILVGFEKTYESTGAGEKYGHTCFIHAIINGTVYFSESYSLTIGGVRYAEGSVIACSISQFANYYGPSWTVFEGIIKFGTDSSSSAPSITYSNIAEGQYYLKNNSNGEYLSVAEGIDANKQNVNTWTFLVGAEFQMNFKKASSGYKIRPQCCTSRLINSYGYTVESGNNVNIWDDTNESSEWWGFEAVSGGYVIRNMMNPSCVLTVNSSGNVYVSTYTGATAQKWTIQNTVSYNANGGSGAPSLQLKDYGKTLTLSSTVPTRSGYKFLGWSTSSSATSATYSAGGSFTSNTNTTLYAVWGKNTYTVSYNANGGSGAPSSQTKTHGASLTLSSTKPTRTGYTFLGWSTSSTATSAIYSAGSSYTNNASVTLYAVWKANTYTISYNANGGTGAPSAQTKVHGSTLTLSSTVPTRAGYNFVGWSTSSTATSATYSAGGSFTSNADTTLYAVWAYKTYTVSYNANGGTGAPSAQTKVHGSTLTLSSTVPTRAGYNFVGWSTSSTATSATYSAGGNYTDNAGATLYAVWEKATYTNTITHWMYVGAGGDNSNGTMKRMGTSTFTGRYGESVVIPNSLIQSYIGHYNTGEAGAQWENGEWSTKTIGGTFIQPSNGMSIEYYYEPKVVEVVFYKNDGSDSVATQTFTYGKSGNRFGYNNDGTPKWSDNSGQFGGWNREGFTLLGWNKQELAVTQEYLVYDAVSDSWIESMVSDDVGRTTLVLYAVWEKDDSNEDDLQYGMRGDVNNDGAINQYDYILVKRHYFETRYLTADEEVRADVNRDGKVDQYDYILIARHYFGTYKIG